MQLTLLIAAALHCGGSPAPLPQQDSSGYVLVWNDEFDADGRPDPAKWDYERGFERNREPQWYQPGNATCKDGFLTIEARKERVPNPNYDPASNDWKKNRQFAEYTSTSMITRGKFQFRYGRVTLRAKIDVRKGSWPAFWMLGANRANGGWPACGEVDIMEFYRGNLLANACWQGTDKTIWDETKWPVAAWGGEKWAEAFHEWELMWDENSMVISVDGKVLNTIDVAAAKNARRGNLPFREDFFLLLNVALGQGGEEIPDAHMPMRMVVDYVRVYQRPS
ncbi:glycoside hydrolase family 16 protein [Chitinophaga sp.]|uniref:glycoside hydrolase family 16 protein n=1 Tax=Chitinophaga sp. TaxID=1869181 RepID=UPI0026245A03|nr:glycoside hydrolase family 16 protein [uncultured Chitinophaga sp.]